ncbi:MAG: hypothetical protein ACRDLF_08925 [Solirubrobacteraceae bacterium]
MTPGVGGHRFGGHHFRAGTLAALLVLGTLGVGACGNTMQEEPVAPGVLEPLVAQEQFPVYWLGSAFRGLGITRVARDPSGSYQIQYGNCTAGGENACVAPLRVVTSPDNSFLPGGGGPRQQVPIRGVRGISTSGGETLVVATGGIVVDLYADSPALAREAAAAMVTIGAPGAPGAPLPRPLPSTGFAAKPLISQQPAAAPMGWTSVLHAH